MQRRPEFSRVRTSLAASAHFRALQGEDLDRIASLCRVYALEDGQPLLKESGELDRFWIVLRGGLRVSSTGDGEEFVYALLGPGSFFGLGYLLSKKPLGVMAGAYGATEVAVIDGERFVTLLDQSPRLWHHIAKVLVDRLSLAMMALRDLSTAPLALRIVRRLLGQAVSGGDLGGDASIELRITQSDLAAMLGASRSKVNAELKRLESQRLIEVRYRTVTLVNLARLRSLAGPDIFAF